MAIPFSLAHDRPGRKLPLGTCRLSDLSQSIPVTQPPSHCDSFGPIAVRGQVRSHDGFKPYSGHWLRPARDRLANNCSPKDTNIFCSVAVSTGVANYNSTRITH
jgi:hypothetical protein